MATRKLPHAGSSSASDRRTARLRSAIQCTALPERAHHTKPPAWDLWCGRTRIYATDDAIDAASWVAADPSDHIGRARTAVGDVVIIRREGAPRRLENLELAILDADLPPGVDGLDDGQPVVVLWSDGDWHIGVVSGSDAGGSMAWHVIVTTSSPYTRRE